MCLWSVWSSPQRGCTVGDRDLSTLTTFPVEKIQVVFIFLHPLSPPLSKHPKEHCKNTNEHSYPKINKTNYGKDIKEWVGPFGSLQPAIHPNSCSAHRPLLSLVAISPGFAQRVTKQKMQDKYKGLLTAQLSGLRDMRHLYQEFEELQKKWWLTAVTQRREVLLRNENKALWARRKGKGKRKKDKRRNRRFPKKWFIHI